MRILVAVAVVVVTAVSAFSQRAHACSCRKPSLFVTEPVAVNAQIPVLDPFSTDTSFTLITEGGLAVTAAAVVVPGGFIVVPTEPLAPNTTFWLTHCDNSGSFRTGSERDDLSPTTPTIAGSSHHVSPLFPAGSACDLGGEGFLISLSSPIDGAFWEVFSGPTAATIDLSTPSMAIQVDASNSFFFGDASLCSSRFPVSKMPSLAIQVRTVDLAGNASELSEPMQLKSGCSITGGSALVLALLLLTRKSLKRGEKRPLH